MAFAQAGLTVALIRFLPHKAYATGMKSSVD